MTTPDKAERICPQSRHSEGNMAQNSHELTGWPSARMGRGMTTKHGCLQYDMPAKDTVGMSTRQLGDWVCNQQVS